MVEPDTPSAGSREPDDNFAPNTIFECILIQYAPIKRNAHPRLVEDMPRLFSVVQYLGLAGSARVIRSAVRTAETRSLRDPGMQITCARIGLDCWGALRSAGQWHVSCHTVYGGCKQTQRQPNYTQGHHRTSFHALVVYFSLICVHCGAAAFLKTQNTTFEVLRLS